MENVEPLPSDAVLRRAERRGHFRDALREELPTARRARDEIELSERPPRGTLHTALACDRLRRRPREFEKRLLQAYGDQYQLPEPFRCREKPLRCRGEVVGNENGLAVGYGLLFPKRPESRYITVYRR